LTNLDGWIKLHRSIMKQADYHVKPFNRLRAWIDMLLLTNYKDGHIKTRGINVPVLRGQLGWSIASLATRWGWTRGTAKRFLNGLQNEGQIEQQNNNVTSIITIINYEKHQGNGQQNGQQNGQPTDSKTDTNKEDVKEVKETKEKREDIYMLFLFNQNLQDSEEFISAWSSWLKYNKERQRPLTETTAQKHAELLNKNMPDHAIMIINKAITSSWGALYPLKDYSSPSASSPMTISEDDIPWPAVAAAERGAHED